MMKIKILLRKFLYYLPISDALYARAKYFYTHRRLLNYKSPRTFNEKIHWLNLSGLLDKYFFLSDKYAVREYVEKKVGSQYLNKLYGVYYLASEIDFATLPQKFVLKATHGSHWNIICRNRDELDEEAVRRQLGEWLKLNYYQYFKERIYKNIPPKIVCEEFIENDNKGRLIDYKFYCFHGKVQLVILHFDRFISHSVTVYDREWTYLPFTDGNIQHTEIDKPENFEHMIQIAEKLAEKTLFVRIDLYNINKRILFGEMTFTPDAGFTKFDPPEWDYKLGRLLKLPDYV